MRFQDYKSHRCQQIKMESKKIKIDIDFKKIINNIKYYFSHLKIDMQIAWGILGLGIILIIVGVILL